MPPIQELGRLTKLKYPQYAKMSDEEVGRLVKQKFPNDPLYAQYTDTPAQQGPGFLGNLAIEGQRFLRKVGDAAQAGGEIVSSALSGDFRPAREAIEIAGRAAAPIVGALGGRPELAGQNFIAGQIQQAAPIAAVNQARTARREAGPDAEYWRRSREDIARLDQRAAQDPSLSGKLTRGAVSLGGEALTALLAGGGSIPATIASGVAMELNTPEAIPYAAALGAIPAARGVAPAPGRSLASEAVQGAGGAIRMSGASVNEGAIRAALAKPLDNVIAEGVKELPRPLAQRVASEIAAVYQVPRSLVASADFSAPFRQGALLTLPPSQWGRAAAAGVKMVQGFSTKRYNRIVEEIAKHPDSQIAQRAGLHLSTQAKEGLKRSEEDFVSKYAGRIPLVKQSQQSYEVYLDSLRLSTFAKYKRLIDRRNISPEAKAKAYQESARWLNIASGRGTFGETIDKGMDALNLVLFAPRFMASRINVLSPQTYLRNATTEGGRVVLRQQMSELFQAASVLASTAALAKAAGAEVSLDPNSSDFLKIKFGRRRFDLLAGEQQVMRLIYRTASAVAKSAQGEKPERGKGALDVSGRFIRSKLAPVPSYFVDFLTRKEYTGRDFNAAKGVAQRVAPLIWQDFLDAYQQEGFGGIPPTIPGVFGVGVQLYDKPEAQQQRK